ncbi:MAG: PINc/VapC family ATPase [Candidatus Methanomethylicia archaeon]
MVNRIVPDTSILVEGKLSKIILDEDLRDLEIIVPRVVLDELQAQASSGSERGFKGLDELIRLRKLCTDRNIIIKFVGEIASVDDIKMAEMGRIDALIRNVAKDYDATLYTMDYVQSLVSEAEGIKVRFIGAEESYAHVKLENFFTSDTMSIHLKEGVPPYAKRGKPGRWELVKIREEPCSRAELEYIIRDILKRCHSDGNAFIEIVRRGAMVIQLGEYRIAIARPPFSDGLEITAVRPIVKVSIDDYALSDKLKRRLAERAEGILICGPPGAGKSTFASALAEFYRTSKNAIVKTMEAPRDLQVRDEITQYAPLEGEFYKTAEILLLVRPDYTVFDELRKTEDFQVFVDMRLAGVGMIGVVHSSSPVDAIHRFIGRIDLGVIPQVIDTVIFIKDGLIKKVYVLDLVVKVPHGMMDEDLARPVVEVRDFETNEVEYEIYTFGEETVIFPIKRDLEVKRSERDFKDLMKFIRRFDSNAELEVLSDNFVIVKVKKNVVPHIIGRNGSIISELERKFNVRIKLQARDEFTESSKIDYSYRETKRSLIFYFDREYAKLNVNLYIDGKYFGSYRCDKRARLVFNLSSDVGKYLKNALDSGLNINFEVSRT